MDLERCGGVAGALSSLRGLTRLTRLNVGWCVLGTRGYCVNTNCTTPSLIETHGVGFVSLERDPLRGLY